MMARSPVAVLRAVLRSALQSGAVAVALIVAGQAHAEAQTQARSAAQSEPQCSVDHVDLRGEWGQMRFAVEVADDARERARGLMFREELGTYRGMLFVYEFPQKVAFWMKNTLIPLDMIFVDERGQVAHVHHEAIPGDLSPIPGGDKIFAVLEINGGLARRFGIVPGDAMRHPSFETDPVWPC